jgi:DNA transposition AAA+ family ATPase
MARQLAPANTSPTAGEAHLWRERVQSSAHDGRRHAAEERSRGALRVGERLKEDAVLLLVVQQAERGPSRHVPARVLAIIAASTEISKASNKA